MDNQDYITIAQFVADLQGAALLFSRYYARSAGVMELRNEYNPEEVLDRAMQAMESRITRNSIEHARIIAMCAGWDYAGFQSAIDAHLLAQMSRFQAQGSRVGWAQGLVDVRGSLEAPNISDFLAGWGQQTMAGAAGGLEITDEERGWMMSDLPPLPGWEITNDEHHAMHTTLLPDVSNNAYNGAVLAPRITGDGYSVAPEQDNFFEISEVDPTYERAADAANATDGETPWGESLRGALGGS